MSTDRMEDLETERLELNRHLLPIISNVWQPTIVIPSFISARIYRIDYRGCFT